jgi:hypothetical protein
MHLILSIIAIWIMMYIWIKMNFKHQQAMQDVRDCRLQSGCLHCTQECSEKIEIKESEI